VVGAGYCFVVDSLGTSGYGEPIVYGHNYGPVRADDVLKLSPREENEAGLRTADRKGSNDMLRAMGGYIAPKRPQVGDRFIFRTEYDSCIYETTDDNGVSATVTGAFVGPERNGQIVTIIEVLAGGRDEDTYVIDFLDGSRIHVMLTELGEKVPA
jgi:hypothetical protein